MASKTITVFGATGVAGSGVMRNLLNAGWNVRAVSRSASGESARPAQQLGAEVMAADLNDRSSIRKVIKGADAVYLSGPSLLNRWDIGQAVQGINVVDAILEEGGIDHFIYQSALVGDARGVLSVGSKRAIEERIAEVKLPATISRPGLFMDNFLTFLKPQKQDGQLVLALPLPLDKILGVVCSDDIGRAAAAIAGDPHKHIGKEYDIVSDLISFRGIAEAITAESGQSVQTVEVPLEALETQWPEGVDLYRWLSTRTTKDSTADLEHLAGSATSFRDWARAKLVPILD